MDPFDMDSIDLAEEILSLLKPILLPRLIRAGAMDFVPQAVLPQELLDMIYTYLSTSCVDLPEKRDGLLPGTWWKQGLISGKLLP